MNRITSGLIAALVAMAMLLTGCTSDSSEGTGEYYAGKTIVVYVGRPPGSGADLQVRSFVRFWQEHIPGKPTMIVKNVPGGGGARVWNLAWDTTNSNDLEIYFSPVSGTAILIKEPGMRAELSRMPLLGGLMSPNMTFARTDRLKKAEDILDVKGLKFGGQAAVHRFSLLGRLSLDILGVDYQNVAGFSGASDVFNALRRREVDIQTAPLNFYRFTVEPNMVRDGEVIPLWYNPVIDDQGTIQPLEAAGDIPSFIDFYESVKGEPPQGELFELYKWLIPYVNGIVYAAFLPPGSTDPALKILRESFEAVTRDEAYLREELKMFGFNSPMLEPEEGTKILQGMESAPEHMRRLLESYIEQGQ
jgi:predicted small secreted protein